jgi:hypothetical protein
MDLWPIPLKNGQFLKSLMYIMYSKMAGSSQKWPIPIKNTQFRGIGQENRPIQNRHFLPSKRYVGISEEIKRFLSKECSSKFCSKHSTVLVQSGPAKASQISTADQIDFHC